MVIIGFLLLAAAAVVGVDVAWQNADTGIDVVAFGQTYSTTMGMLFVAGVVTALVAAMGIMLLNDGSTHFLRRRREHRDAAAERDRLLAEMDERRAKERQTLIDLRDREPSGNGHRDGELAGRVQAAEHARH